MFESDTITEVTQEQAVSESVGEIQEQSETNALDEFMAEPEAVSERDSSSEGEAVETAEQTQTEENAELPKGIKGRILAAETKAEKRGYDKARAEAQKEWELKEAQYAAELAEYREFKFNEEAKAFAKKENCSLEIARRLLRAEKGIVSPVSSEKPVQTSKTDDTPVLSDERKAQLNGQIDSIKNKYGIDVMKSVTEEDAQAIFAGTMDLWEVAIRSMSSSAEKQTTSAPKPVKGGGSSTSVKGGMDFSTMSDEDFDRFQAKIARGAVFKPR